MIKTLYDYIEDITEEVNSNDKLIKSLTGGKKITQRMIKQILKEIERYVEMCIRKGYMLQSEITLKPYSSSNAQYILKRMYDEAKILDKQLKRYKYVRKKKIQRTNQTKE